MMPCAGKSASGMNLNVEKKALNKHLSWFLARINQCLLFIQKMLRLNFLWQCFHYLSMFVRYAIGPLIYALLCYCCDGVNVGTS